MVRHGRKHPRFRFGATRRSRIFKASITLCIAALIVGAALFSTQLSGATAAPQDDGISPEALAQIDALIREKESRSPTQRKMDSQLIYELKMDRGQENANGLRA